MKKIVILSFLIVIASTRVASNPIDRQQAAKAAETYLKSLKKYSDNDRLSLCETIEGKQGTARLYIFNISDRGFIIMGADDDMSPMIGYSFNGTFDRSAMPPQLLSWIDTYDSDYTAATQSELNKETIEAERKQWKQKWQKLLNDDATATYRDGAKNEFYLLRTRWSQGAGYNNYCPEYGSGHCVTGCVATAMAQIIRYHEYPRHGYTSHTYVHPEYGALSANFEDAEYEYENMPTRVNAYSSADYQNAVSLLLFKIIKLAKSLILRSFQPLFFSLKVIPPS